MAGPVAESMRFGEADGCATDLRSIEAGKAKLIQLGMTPRQSESGVGRLGNQVHEMLVEHWRIVEKIADTLLEHGELDGEEIAELFRL